MTLPKRIMAGATGLLLAIGALAAPVEISGVKLDDPVDVRGTPLQLNGAGIRYKAIFKVYVAGLYLGTKAVTPEQAYAAPGPKRLTITLLRDIEPDVLNKSMTEAFENNTPIEEIARLTPGLVTIKQAFADQKKLRAGENFTLDWIPGTGTILSIKGIQQGEPFKGLEFFNALIRLWVGPRPADFKLKEALLGKGS